jgi:glutaredoxin
MALDDTDKHDEHRRDPAEAARGHVAVLYRMVMPDHLCPYGLKSRWLLKRQGFEVDDRPLTSRAETDAFKRRHGVETTPQTWIDGERVGGYDDLRVLVGKLDPEQETSYAPVIALFGVAALTALAFASYALGGIWHWQTLGWFISISMILLGLQKLRDVESFSTMFLNYDLLARRWVGYGYLYPFVETGAGIAMTAMVLTPVAAPAALFIGTVGAVSVFKAVYVDKRELRCACMGGQSDVPLGFVSLTENLMMVAMSTVMLALWWG